MKQRPNILNGLETVLGSKKIESFVDEKDYLVIEDSSGRIRISDIKIPNTTISQICSGVFAAIK